MTGLAGRFGLYQHVLGPGQLGLVALPLALCQHHWQHHLKLRSNEARHLVALPPESAPLQEIAEIFLLQTAPAVTDEDVC